MRRRSVVNRWLLSLLLPVTVVAQTRDLGYVCNRHGQVWYTEKCSGSADCARVQARHLYCVHGEGSYSGACTSSGQMTPIVVDPPMFTNVSPFFAILRPGIFGGAIAGTIGTLFKAPDSTSYGWPAAAAGASAGIATAVVKNAGRWNPVAAAIVGGVAGAAGGYAVGAYQDAQIVKGSANDLGEPSKVLPYAQKGAAIGAAAGALVSIASPKEGFRSFPALRSFLQPDGRISMLQGAKRLGVNIKW